MALSTTRKQRVTFLAAFLALVALGWLLAPHTTTDPEVARVRALFESTQPNPDAPPEQQLAAMKSVRAEVEKLSPDQRKQLFANTLPPPARMMIARAEDYVALPEKEKRPFLDREIQKMQQMRRMMGSLFGGNRTGASPTSAQPTRNTAASKASAASSSTSNSATANTGSSGAGPGGPFGGGPGRGLPPLGGPGNPEFFKTMLDNTTPEERAAMGQFMSDLTSRMKELGIQPPGPPGA
jgi:hypothetical protein